MACKVFVTLRWLRADWRYMNDRYGDGDGGGDVVVGVVSATIAMSYSRACRVKLSFDCLPIGLRIKTGLRASCIPRTLD